MEKRKKIIIAASIGGILCLAGIALAVVFTVAKKNPLIKGLANLAEEIQLLEEEQGENFWTDMLNQMGQGNAQGEYSCNISGIPVLQKATIGLDGSIRRDMENRLCAADVQVSVANAKVLDIYGFGKEEDQAGIQGSTVYLQVPSIWEGSVVLGTKSLSKQWNQTNIKAQLEQVSGKNLALPEIGDVNLFEEFSVEDFSAKDFLQEKEEAFKELYQKMEIVKPEKAWNEGVLEEEQKELLENYELLDNEGGIINNECYVIVLPKEELEQIVSGVTEAVRLCVYLDSAKRIVRISGLPGETIATAAGEETFSLNLLGTEKTVDSIEIEFSHVGEGKKLISGLSEEELRLEGKAVINREAAETVIYHVEADGNLEYKNRKSACSVAGDIEGKNEKDIGRKSAVLKLDNLTWKEQGNTVLRLSGSFSLEPLEDEVEIPSGKEYRIGEMGKIETLLFLAECGKNLYTNFSGYLSFLK